MQCLPGRSGRRPGCQSTAHAVHHMAPARPRRVCHCAQQCCGYGRRSAAHMYRCTVDQCCCVCLLCGAHNSFEWPVSADDHSVLCWRRSVTHGVPFAHVNSSAVAFSISCRAEQASANRRPVGVADGMLGCCPHYLRVDCDMPQHSVQAVPLAHRCT